MGLFDRWFGKKPVPLPADKDEGAEGHDDDDELDDAPAKHGRPILGPPDFVRAAEMQRAYWTHDPDEMGQLAAQGVDRLSFRDLLRLHHLTCLERVEPGVDRVANGERLHVILRRLLSEESPYRPRSAMIWQGKLAQPDSSRTPEIQGQLCNPSLTHLGSLEVYRVDTEMRPVRVDFVGFDELSGVIFASPSLIRAAKLFYEDGRAEVVTVPLLYGLTWALGDEHDRSGQMTRFVRHFEGADTVASDRSGIGVGQQDLTASSAEGLRMFGLGSVAEIVFPLDMRDPRFEEKARQRGMDPVAIRKQHASRKAVN